MQIFLFVFAIALALSMWGGSRFRKIYAQETEQTLGSGLTGAEMVERILAARGIEGVGVGKSRGLLPDFYEPSRRTITLSPEHFSGRDFSSLAVAAQQAGKAIQHHEGHRPLLWRNSAIRWTAYLAGPVLIAAGVTLAMGMNKTVFPLVLLAWSVIAFWNMATIPTELDAGERAKKVLEKMKVFRNLDERVGVERVMGAWSTAYLDGMAVVANWAKRVLLPWMRKQM